MGDVLACKPKVFGVLNYNNLIMKSDVLAYKPKVIGVLDYNNLIIS